MNVNVAPVCRYAFLLEKPVLYIRPISLKENVTTNVKFLTISHNKAYKPIPLLSTDSVYCCGRVLGIVND